MKNVLVLMHDDAGQEARFQAALDLTRVLDGHLTCVDVAIVPVTINDYAEFGGTALLMSDEQAREKANRAQMEARLRVEDVPHDWIEASGLLAPCVRDATGLADLVVLNRKLDSIDFPDMRTLVGELVIETGRPIVAVPEDVRSFDAFGHAVVAWDGSAQAEAALRAATPLLQHARAVTIVEVDDGSLKQPAAEAAEYLSRHGIHSTIRREVAVADRPSSILLDTVVEQHAAYLVMGGFSHSRFREATFGGVTRRMLAECPVPLFLAH